MGCFVLPKLSDLAFFFFLRLLMTSISWVVISVLELFIWFWFNFGKWFISFRYFNFAKCGFWSVIVFPWCLVLSPFRFWFVNLDTLSLPFSNFGSGLVYLVDVLKRPNLCFIDSLYFSLHFYFIGFNPQFFILFCFVFHLFLLDVFASLCSREYRGTVKSLVCYLYSSSTKAPSAMILLESLWLCPESLCAVTFIEF